MLFSINGLEHTRYDKEGTPKYLVTINASHVTITRKHKDGSRKVVYSRQGRDDDFNGWYDESHKRIVAARHALEEALNAAIDTGEQVPDGEWMKETKESSNG